ncbi:MAG: hypothetical protein ACRDPX_06740 [Gaiellaceae bacterium]
MASPLTRRFAVLLSTAVLLGALAAAASVEQRAHASYAYRLSADANTPLSANRLAQVPITYRGGPITASTGDIVDVRVSDSLPVETSTPEGWAEFLAKLTHGAEIAQLTTYIVTFDEVQQICGSRALGCYGDDQIVAPGEIAADIAPEEVVRHEYGHHIANHRSNPPWIAIDWGPKRWASAASVCARVGRREAHPGDQGSNYALNPGEAWAETYRLMDERKIGITTATWQIVASSFFPSEAALQAAELDVTQPWAAPRTTASTRVFGRRTPKVWWIRLATPLDGDFRITATMPNGGTHEVAHVGANRRTVVKRAGWTGQRVKRLDGTVCGQRSSFVRVTQKGALGRVRVSVTIP